MAPARELLAYLDGHRVGIVTQRTTGALGFAYEPSYAEDPVSTPLSLSMPLSRTTHTNKSVSAFLWGLLPDSQEARERLGREFGASPNNPFALLSHVGQDAAGAVQLLPPGAGADDAAVRRGDVRWLTDGDLDATVRSLATHSGSWDPGPAVLGRWSLAGAQPKVALFRDESGRYGVPRDSTPTTHIIKPMPDHLTGHHVNEYLCLTAARLAGLPAARVEIIETDAVRAVVSERYDRTRVDGHWRRIHQEDLCQALSVHPALKYQSDGGPGVGEIADLFRRLRPADRVASGTRFVEALALNVLIGGTDAHAKNYSMLLSGPRAQLAPLYDVASAAPYPQHQRLLSPMRIGLHTRFLDVGEDDWGRVGRRLGLGGDETVSRVARLRDALPAAFADAVEGLPADVRELGAAQVERIVAHAQRRWRPDLARDPRDVLPKDYPGDPEP